MIISMIHTQPSLQNYMSILREMFLGISYRRIILACLRFQSHFSVLPVSKGYQYTDDVIEWITTHHQRGPTHKISFLVSWDISPPPPLLLIRGKTSRPQINSCNMLHVRGASLCYNKAVTLYQINMYLNIDRRGASMIGLFFHRWILCVGSSYCY